ncbi:MAG: hypothetical protein V1685_06555 [Parcubacteria group bacterium]
MADPNPEELQTSTAPLETEHGKLLAEWEFPEFIQYKRSRAWYISSSAVAIGGFALSLLSKNLLFAIIIVIIAILYFIRDRQRPGTVVISITEDGISIGERFYSHESLKQFWLIYEPPAIKRLYVRFQSGLRPNLSIPVEDQDPVALRAILLKYLEEDLDQRGESFSDGFQRILKL